MLKFLLLFFIFPGISVAEEVKLMTWNVFMLPPPIRFSHQKVRTDAMVDYFKGAEYDLIFLQEAFSTTFQRTIKNSLKKNYPYFKRLKKKPGIFPFVGPGLAVLSKHPLKTMGQVYFSKCATADCFASKGAHLVEVTFPSGKRLQIANTHMQSGSRHLEIRKAQLEDIRSLLRTHKKDSVSQLLVGDLNIDSSRGLEFSGSLTMLQMFPANKGHLLRANPSEKGKVPLSDEAKDFFSAGYSVPCLKSGKQPFQKLLDHVLFYDAGGKMKFTDDRILFPEFYLKGKSCPLSDHRPRVVTLEI